MIFVTVGHQMPFDRMIKTVDAWVGARPGLDVFAQIGDAPYIPGNIKYTSRLTPAEFDAKIRACDIVVAHAGTGTIIKAHEFEKPIWVMPRKASLGETRNDHQVHTVELFLKRGYIKSFEDEVELDNLLSHTSVNCGTAISQFASAQLIEVISHYIAEAP